MESHMESHFAAMESLFAAMESLTPLTKRPKSEKETAIDAWLPITSSRKAKWWYSAFDNVTALVGAGVLDLADALSELGWGPRSSLHRRQTSRSGGPRSSLHRRQTSRSGYNMSNIMLLLNVGMLSVISLYSPLHIGSSRPKIVRLSYYIYESFDPASCTHQDELQYPERNSLLALNDQPIPYLFCLYGMLNSSHPVRILIDSGSTYNVIQHRVVKSLRLPTASTTRFPIHVANGAKLICRSKCLNTTLCMQETQFQLDFIILKIQGDIDIVLGVEWLRTLGDITINLNSLTMNFEWNGQACTLQGDIMD